MKLLIKQSLALCALSIVTTSALAQQGMGIGNNNPLEMLDVSGAIKVGTDINNSNAAPTGGAGTIRFKAGEFQGWDGTSWIPLGGGADTDWVTNSNNIYNGNTGNVGIGTTTPNAKLNVNGEIRITDGNLFRMETGTGLMTIKTVEADNYVQWDVGGAGHFDDAFYIGDISSSTNEVYMLGNVGIGNDTPTEKLDVTGSIRMEDGNQQAGYIPVSDINGTMTWTDPSTITTAADGDGDSNNELQTLSQTGTDVTLSNGGGTISVADNDNSVSNELQTLSVSGNQVTLSNGGGTVTVEDIDDDWTVNGNDIHNANSGNVGIKTTTPLASLDIKSTASGEQLLRFDTPRPWAFEQNSTGSSTQLILRSESNGKRFCIEASDGTRAAEFSTLNAGASEVYLAPGTGNVGIGTTTPNTKLNVNGEVRITDGNLFRMETGTGLMTIKTVEAGNYVQWDVGGTGHFDDAFYIGDISSPTNEVYMLGNVGIGNDNPGEKLDVAGKIRMQTGATTGYIPVSDINGTMTWTDPSTITTAADGDGDSNNELQTLSQTGTDVTLSNGGGTISIADNDNSVSNELQTLSVSGNQVTLSNGGGTVTVEDVDDDWTVNGNDIHNANSGNVGIGTTSPGALLEVQGNESGVGGIQISNSADRAHTWLPYINGSIYLTGDEDAGTGDIILRSWGNNDYTDHVLVQAATGNVGVGTTSPSQKLDVNGSVKMRAGATAGHIPVSDNVGTMIWTDPTTLVTADDGDWTVNGNNIYNANTANVGIGTTNPAQKLDVAGKIQMQTGATTGYIPVSDANGTMTWTDPATIFTSDDGDWTVNGNNIYNANTGSVGIGTNTPSEKLDISADIEVNGLKLGCGNGGNITNTRFGFGALGAGTPGTGNTAVGSVTLANATGNQNTAVGKGALWNTTTGNFNTVMGGDAGVSISTGSDNVVVGRAALMSVTTGSNNTVVGKDAGRSGPNRSGNVYLGYQAGYYANGDNKLYIENSNSAAPLIYGEFDNNIVGINGDLGVGTTNPSQKLDVNGSIKMRAGAAAGHIPVSDNVGTMTWTDPTTLFTADDGDWAVNGNNIYNANTANVGIGTNSPTSKFEVDGDVEISGSRLHVGLNGRVGIGTNSPITKLDVHGGVSGDHLFHDNYVARIRNTFTDANNSTQYNGMLIQAGKENNNGANSVMIGFDRPGYQFIGKIVQNNANSVAYQTSSDIRLKKDIQHSHYTLQDLMNIDVKDYVFKTDKEEVPQTGFIAQQLHTIFPNAVTEGGEDPKTDPWMVDYGKVTPLIVKAVQDLKAEKDQLQEQLLTQQEQIEMLLQRVGELEAASN